jgi:predicted transposase/invertase (TIGR01784 family)
VAARIQLDDADDPIDICMDNVFKAVFTRDTPESKTALSRLVSAFIGYEVSITNIKANEPAVDSLKERQIRFDINCVAENGELLNVEMSLNPDDFEPVRLEYHAGKLFTAQELRGVEKNFNDLKRAYQITILGKERFFPDGYFFHLFEYYDPERQVSLGGRSHVITLELSKLQKVAEKPAMEMSVKEQWAVYFKYLKDKKMRRKINEIIELEEGIAMASEVLMTISKDMVERLEQMSIEKHQLDIQSKLVTAKRKGEQIGIEIGMEKGMEKGKIEIAKNLLNEGLSLDIIQRVTGVDTKTIQSL